MELLNATYLEKNSTVDDGFEKELCEFYCQLEFWRTQAVQNGLDLPQIKQQNKKLTPLEKWRVAVSERDRLAAIWRLQASNQGIVLDPNEPRVGIQENNEGELPMENLCSNYCTDSA